MADPLLNEFVANHTGTDSSEYIEIKGDALADYSGWTLVQIEGDAGGTGRVISATEIGTTDADGYWSSGFQSNLLQNGSGTLLLVETYSGTIGQDLDTNDDGVLDLTPWTRIGDGVAIDDGGSGDRFYSTTVLTPGFDGAGLTVGGASRLPDGTDTDSAADWTRNDFDLAGLPGQTGTPAPGEALNTPGAENAPVPDDTPDFRAIYEIQGAGHRSEFEGDRVATRGVVTAIASNGFYIQDAQGDGNTATSDAVFVFTGSGNVPAEVQLGVTLDVTGTVTEFKPGGASTHNLTITQITGAEIEISAVQQTVPVAVSVGAGGYAPPTEAIDDDGRTVYDPGHDGVDYWESLEGMLVDIPAPVVIGATNNFGEAYVLADNGDHATGTRSGAGGLLISETDQQPERIQIDDDLLGSFMPDFNVGAELGTVQGVVSYNFGWYEVQATQAVTVESPGTLAPETTTLTGDRDHLTVGSINLENLDPKVEDVNLVEDQDPDNVDDDVGSGKFDRLAEQIVGNMGSPDIVALQEVQDSDGAEITGVTSAAETARVLIEAIVAHGGPRYEYVDVAPADGTSGGQPGGNIRVGYLYNPERVDLVEGSVKALTDPDLSDGDAFAASRLPLAADFVFNGETVTLVNNHFTSKSGSSPTYGEDFPPINRGEDQREAQAAIVNAYVDGRLAADPDAKVMVVGDLNEFSWNDPLKVLRGEDDGSHVLKDLADELLPANERWSYVFEGGSQELDHMLATDGVYKSGLEFDIVHTNAGFADQVSDHDPSVARLHIPAPGTPENPNIIVADKPTFLFNFAIVKGTGEFDEVRASVNVKANDAVERIVLQGDRDLIAWAGNTDTQIAGNTGDNTIYGGAGNDRIAGGAGNDLLIGGRGTDVFAFGHGDGRDVIADFDVRHDKLLIADGADFTVRAGLLSTVVELDDGTRVTLLGVRPDQIEHADWMV
ncbi:endonuclease/exonuclease/phosphatase family protein [Inquilinus limosus]|uniref:endonuclease/exonuclease/phosphatase family protein n=1 Tax=Inquilinus limosus TaxID=171674 RepID=UPI0004181070|nr:endonuclease/exonuclease/phosphatase family protein [Inquilinus limosus]